MEIGPDKGLLAEINVTPLVDVMLVLLIIFMMSASIETVQAKKKAADVEKQKQKVEVNLPRIDAKAVNLKQDKILVLTFTKKLKFYLQDIPVEDCGSFGARLRRRSRHIKKFDAAFDKCLDGLTEKLVTNEKLKKDRKLYMKADKDLPYGLVLRVMARVRRGGISRFGLIADPATEDMKKR